MKTLAIYCIVLMLTLPRLGAVEHNRAHYQRLAEIDDETKRVINQLEDIEIDDVSFEKLSAAAAMAYLTKKVVGEKGGGAINFVIRGADQAKKVGITRKSLTFAQAVDEICRQSGRVWMISFNGTSGAPILVIKNMNGQQDAAGQPATRPESK